MIRAIKISKNLLKKENLMLMALILIFSHINSQTHPSEEYYQIRNNENYTEEIKINQIQNLLRTHLVNKTYEQYGLDLTAFSFWLYRKKHFEIGISNTKKAIEFYKSQETKNSNLYFRNLDLLASYYALTGNYTDSNEILFEILNSEESNAKAGKNYRRIAENYNALSNYHTATFYFLKASEAYRKEKRYRKLFENTIWLSKNYQLIFDDNSTIKGINSLKDLDTLKQYIKFDLFDEYLINERLGNFYNYQGLFNSCESLPYYKKALSIAKQLNLNQSISTIYQNIGYLYRDKDNDSALFYFKKAIQYPHQDIIINSQNLYALGFAYLDNEEYDKAHSYMTLALDKLKTNKTTNSTKSNISKYKDRGLTIQILKNTAITRIKKFEETNENEILVDALSYLKQADQLIDLIRLESTYKESKLFWRRSASEVYINFVKVCYLQNNPELAYRYLEKNKALLLLEDLTEEQSKIFFNIPDSIIKKELVFKRKIALIKNKLLSETYSDKDRSLELFELKNQYTSFIDSLQYKFPKYYHSKEEASILSFDKVLDQASKTNTSFIHYILNDDLGYALVISEDKQELYEIPDIPLLQNYIAHFHELSSTPFASKSDRQEFQKLARELYKKLLPDTLFQESKNKIIIIPDDSLLSFPFETLMNKEGNYLIEEHEISYAYSISFLEQNKMLKRNPKKEFLGMAPIDYEYLPTLTNSAKEVQTIAKKFKSDILVKDNASKENLINSLPDYKIIHLSTHANANDSIIPWIATSTKKITLNDIYGTKNNAELVTLSACNTAKGKLQKGEGVMSIARGFFNTGSNSVVSTLWKADDESTKKIITNFYTHLKNGASKSEALRNAKLEYLKNHSLSEASPYYWSSFVLIGNPDPMYSSLNSIYILIGSIISFLLLFTFFRKISKK